MWAGSSAPTNAFLTQGQAISRTTYATLFGLIGTAFGAGDGSTTFNIPNLQGRVPVGAGAGTWLTPRTLGAIGGEEGHSQTGGEMAGHVHGVNDPSHAHLANAGGNTSYEGLFTSPGVTNNALPGGSGMSGLGSSPVFVDYGAGLNTDGHITGISIALAGGGLPANVMQPFVALNFIIYAL